MSAVHLYLRNASRTNKTPAAGIVRVAQREADTERGEGRGAVQYGIGSSSAIHLDTGYTVTEITQTKTKRINLN